MVAIRLRCQWGRGVNGDSKEAGARVCPAAHCLLFCGETQSSRSGFAPVFHYTTVYYFSFILVARGFEQRKRKRRKPPQHMLLLLALLGEVLNPNTFFCWIIHLAHRLMLWINLAFYACILVLIPCSVSQLKRNVSSEIPLFFFSLYLPS
jgi:hypothetical protein